MPVLILVVVALYTCLGLLSIGRWGPWVLGTCSGSVLALRLVIEVIVLGTPHLAPACYPWFLGSPEKW